MVIQPHTLPAEEEISTFGFHSSGSLPSPEKELMDERALRCNRLAFYAIFSIAAVTAVITAAFLCPITVPIAIAGGSAGAGLVSEVAFKVIRYRKICKTAGMIFNHESLLKFRAPEGRCDMLPTRDCAETLEWRKRLIASAEHNIVISGNYCGDKEFIQLLDAIEQRLEEVPGLEVVIISSPKFLKKNHHKKMNKLRNTYGGQFSLVQSPDIWHISPGVKKATNHTKVTVVDYGRRFILGGSGIKTSFSGTGLFDAAQPTTSRVDGYGIHGMLERILPGHFRDEDFIGESPIGRDTLGTQLYTQSLLLAHRWQSYNSQIKGLEKTGLVAEELALLGAENPSRPQAGDTLTTKLLKTPVPPDLDMPSLPEFARDPRRTENIRMKILSQGPQDSKSTFARELLKQFANAHTEIVISHMYFHPSQEIFDALVAAANRGVRITILTNGVYPGSPKSHDFFAPRNRYNYIALRNAVLPEFQDNISVYEFTQPKRGFHKKIVVVDRETVIAGSSNFGYKSLVTTSDDEINFTAKSRGFAKEVLETFETDVRHSTEVDDFTLTADVTRSAFIHRFLAPLIG